MITSRLLHPICRCRLMLFSSNSISKQINRSKSQSALSKTVKNELDTNVKLGEKVKETTKTASYLGIILLGVGVTGSLFYAVFNELFSSKSPNNVYSKAVERCKADPRIQDKLGLPITAFGAETTRRRRHYVSHVIYQRDGRQCLRMKFYLKGSFHQGTVQLEMVENDSGKYEYRYLFVQVDDLLQTAIVLEDNRNTASSSSQPLDLTL
ncbi:mitochondrial import inner membrane translocase subunit Tim21 [Tribolium madens]|uniref:mitochondrial import inner membrane translocase subunit Tim21 n=1 Tax=Tribolium madens TaxID=41895 RepID=UPI001CF7273C|nr:mitochondrial import inner membrane translocase subunit Tim21 [Tribolium madens]